jgi:glutathione S-transferase
MITLYGRNNSINVQKALWALAEAGVAFERIDVGGAFGGNDTPEYLAMNPNGRIPTLDDGGFILWESNVIVRYVAAKYGDGLWPSDNAERALAEQWMDWEQTTVEPTIRPVFWGLIRTPPEERDLDEIGRARQELIDIWGRLDRHLADRAYVLGERFTMGDIPPGAVLHRWLSFASTSTVPSCPIWRPGMGASPSASPIGSTSPCR